MIFYALGEIEYAIKVNFTFVHFLRNAVINLGPAWAIREALAIQGIYEMREQSLKCNRLSAKTLT